MASKSSARRSRSSKKQSPDDAEMTAVPLEVAKRAYERANKYSGAGRMSRKIAAARRNPELWASVAPKIVAELKKTENLGLYQIISSSVKDELEWDVQPVTERAKKEIESLNRKCDQNRNDRSEAIKAEMAAGNFMYQRGIYPQAAQKFIAVQEKLRQLPGPNSIDNAKKMLLCCIYGQAKFRNVEPEIRSLDSAKHFPDEDYRAREKACLKAGSGVVALVIGDFNAAANAFSDPKCTIAMGDSFKEALRAEDVAIYGGVCALAAFSRSDLKKKVIENDSFKDFLDLQPEMKKLIHSFYGSDYSECMDILRRMKGLWSLDPLLRNHFANLSELIENKAMVQYFRPYARADIKQMAKAFNMSLEELEARVSKLIIAKKISARIDSQNKVMIAKHADERTTTFDKVLANGESFIYDVQTAMLRLSLREAGLAIKRPPMKGMVGRGRMGGLGNFFGGGGYARGGF